MAENNDEGAEKQTKSTPEKTKLSLMSGIALLIGSIIGSGIFISPRGVLLGTGKFQSHFSFFIHIKIYLYCLFRFLWFISYCMGYLRIHLCSRMFMLC